LDERLSNTSGKASQHEKCNVFLGYEGQDIPRNQPVGCSVLEKKIPQINEKRRRKNYDLP
jgi:hypothetical protein